MAGLLLTHGETQNPNRRSIDAFEHASYRIRLWNQKYDDSDAGQPCAAFEVLRRNPSYSASSTDATWMASFPTTRITAKTGVSDCVLCQLWSATLRCAAPTP